MPNKSKQNTTKSNKTKSKLTPATNNTPDNTDNTNKREQPVDKKFALVAEKPATPGEMALANREEKLGTENVSKNPYVEVVQKRLRSLGKRRMKHLQYEEILRSGDQTLNPDQLQTLKLKDNVEFAIQELESIIKSLNSVENEELENVKNQKKAQEIKHEESIAEAVKQTKDLYSGSILSLLRFFRLIHYQNVSIVQLAEIENEAVTHFRDLLNHLVGEASIEERKEQSIREVMAHVEKLHQGDKVIVHRPVTINGVEDESVGISYSNILSLAINPPIPENFDEIINSEDDDIEERVPIQYNDLQVEHSYYEDIESDESLNENAATQINNDSPEIFDGNYHEDNDSQHLSSQQVDNNNPSDFQNSLRHIVDEQLFPPNNEPSLQPENSPAIIPADETQILLPHNDDPSQQPENLPKTEANAQSPKPVVTIEQIADQHQQLSSVDDDNENLKQASITTNPPSQVITDHEQSAENQTENNNLTQPNHQEILIANNPSQKNISSKSQETSRPSSRKNSLNSVHPVVSPSLNQNQRNAGEKRRDPRSENGQNQSSRPIQRRNSNKRYNNQQRQTDRRRNNYAQNGQENFGRNVSPPRNSRLSPKNQPTRLSNTNPQNNYLNNDDVTPSQNNTAYQPRTLPRNPRSDPPNKILPRLEQPKDPVHIQSTQLNPLVHPLLGYQQLGNNGYLNSGGNYQFNGYRSGRGALNRNGAGYQGVRSINNVVNNATDMNSTSQIQVGVNA